MHLAFVFQVCVRPINRFILHDHSQLTLSASNLCRGSLQREQSAACRKALQQYSRPLVWHQLKALAQGSATDRRSVCLSGCADAGIRLDLCYWLTSLVPDASQQPAACRCTGSKRKGCCCCRLSNIVCRPREVSSTLLWYHYCVIPLFCDIVRRSGFAPLELLRPREEWSQSNDHVNHTTRLQLRGYQNSNSRRFAHQNVPANYCAWPSMARHGRLPIGRCIFQEVLEISTGSRKEKKNSPRRMPLENIQSKGKHLVSY